MLSNHNKHETLKTHGQIRLLLHALIWCSVVIVLFSLLYSCWVCLRKIVVKSKFSEQFRKLINRYKRIGYNSYMLCGILQLLTQPRLIAMLHSLIARRRVGPQLTDGLDIKLSQVGWGLMLYVFCLLIYCWKLVVSLNSGLQWGISQEYSFFVSSQWSVWFCVFAEMHWLRQEAIMRTELFIYIYFFALRNISGLRVKFVQWKT